MDDDYRETPPEPYSRYTIKATIEVEITIDALSCIDEDELENKVKTEVCGEFVEIGKATIETGKIDDFTITDIKEVV